MIESNDATTRVAEISVRDASAGDTRALAVLFDAYRVFYERPPDAARTEAFVRERIDDGTTRFRLASIGGEPAGFTHLLPAYDTLEMRPAWILEDLFVAPHRRRAGVATALLRDAETLARATGASRVSLTTAHTNLTAQRLYERHGYRLDETFRAYHRSIA